MKAVRTVIDGRVFWFVDSLHESAVAERFRSMCVMDSRGETELVEVEIRMVERDTPEAAE